MATVDKNTEPATSARTTPGPSAMALNKECWRRVLPRRLPLFAEPVLPDADADGRAKALRYR